jgi:hypothetical protein
MLFHHDPGRTDDAVDALLAPFRDRAVDVAAASEATVIELRRSGSGQ